MTKRVNNGYEVEFPLQNKGQYINYLNKVSANPAVEFVTGGHRLDRHAYVIFYTYKTTAAGMKKN